MPPKTRKNTSVSNKNSEQKVAIETTVTNNLRKMKMQQLKEIIITYTRSNFNFIHETYDINDDTKTILSLKNRLYSEPLFTKMIQYMIKNMSQGIGQILLAVKHIISMPSVEEISEIYELLETMHEQFDYNLAYPVPDFVTKTPIVKLFDFTFIPYEKVSDFFTANDKFIMLSFTYKPISIIDVFDKMYTEMGSLLESRSEPTKEQKLQKLHYIVRELIDKELLISSIQTLFEIENKTIINVTVSHPSYTTEQNYEITVNIFISGLNNLLASLFTSIIDLQKPLSHDDIHFLQNTISKIWELTDLNLIRPITDINTNEKINNIQEAAFLPGKEKSFLSAPDAVEFQKLLNHNLISLDENGKLKYLIKIKNIFSDFQNSFDEELTKRREIEMKIRADIEEKKRREEAAEQERQRLEAELIAMDKKKTQKNTGSKKKASTTVKTIVEPVVKISKKEQEALLKKQEEDERNEKNRLKQLALNEKREAEKRRRDEEFMAKFLAKPKTPSPKTPSPKTPSPKTPSSKAPSPKAPSPKAPSPKTPSPKSPSPELKPLLEPELKPLLEPELKPLLEPELKPLLEPELKPLLEPLSEPLSDTRQAATDNQLALGPLPKTPSPEPNKEIFESSLIPTKMYSDLIAYVRQPQIVPFLLNAFPNMVFSLPDKSRYVHIVCATLFILSEITKHSTEQLFCLKGGKIMQLTSFTEYQSDDIDILVLNQNREVATNISKIIYSAFPDELSIASKETMPTMTDNLIKLSYKIPKKNGYKSVIDIDYSPLPAYSRQFFANLHALPFGPLVFVAQNPLQFFDEKQFFLMLYSGKCSQYEKTGKYDLLDTCSYIINKFRKATSHIMQQMKMQGINTIEFYDERRDYLKPLVDEVLPSFSPNDVR